MSREHYLSAGILKIIGNGAGIYVSGYSWCPVGERIKVGIGSLQANILCQKHNTELSALDSNAISLFEYFSNIEDSQRGKKEASEIKIETTVNGDLFERWLLKYVIGVMYSKNASAGKSEINKRFVDDEIVKILFGLIKWPITQGLYLDDSKKIGLSTKCFNTNLWAHAATGKLVLAMCDFHGLPFTLMLSNTDRPKEELERSDLIHNHVYHPTKVIINKMSERYEVKILWSEGVEKGGDVFYFMP